MKTLLPLLVMLLAGPAGGRERLPSGGETALRTLVEEGSHPDLLWPDFSQLREDVARFYRDGGDALAWSGDAEPTKQARALAGLLRDAGRKGLRAEDYDGPRWEERMARLNAPSSPPSESERVRFDVALTVSALRYLSDVQAGRLNPGFRSDPGLVKQKRALSVVLRSIAMAEDVPAVVAAIEPPFPAYQRTLRALEAYAELARRDNGERLPVPRKAIKPGEAYPGVVRLTRLLEELGDLPALPPGALVSSAYDGALVEAVTKFQRRHGLDPDGRLGARTVEQLNRPFATRLSQLELTLERWRWLPRTFPVPPVVVNIAEFRLHAGDAGQRWSGRVVVGKAYLHQTPVFAGEMKYIVFHPFWNVPLDIQREEIVPQARKRPAYLNEGHYEIVDRHWRPVSVPPGAALDQLRSGALRLRQTPGPHNSLGAVKFVFPNNHDVYLHGTPSPSLFQQSRRDFSHGCIRVEDPARLAAWVLRDRPEWTVDHIREAMNGSSRVQVNLLHPIPVLILYATAVVEENGEVRFFEDVYAIDAELEHELAKRRPYVAERPVRSPAPHASRVHVDKVRRRVVAQTASLQGDAQVP